jgi:hypothetical protein
MSEKSLHVDQISRDQDGRITSLRLISRYPQRSALIDLQLTEPLSVPLRSVSLNDVIRNEVQALIGVLEEGAAAHATISLRPPPKT